MLRNQIHSLANPILGSASFGYGVKSGEKYITFSVGTKVSTPLEYVVKDSYDNDVTFSIFSGILTFSHPQTHAYVGVGDVVKSNGSDVYLNRKINPSQWVVMDRYGNIPDNADSLTLSSIDKTFSSAYEAVGGYGGGIETLLETNNLVNLNSILRVSLYEMTDTYDAALEIDGWVTDEHNYVKILAPYDIRSECNSKQRHAGITNTGYTRSVPSLASSSIIIKSQYTEIEGLAINCPNSVFGIWEDSLNLNCKYINNIVNGAIEADMMVAGGSFIVGNILYDSAKGIDDTAMDNATIINNTIVDCPIGITGGANTKSLNNLIQGSTPGSSIVGLVGGNISNTITDDSDGDIALATINFRDAASDDFHIDFNSIDTSIVGADPITGGDSSVTDIFVFSTDIDSEKMDGDGWPIGADRFAPEANFAIGKSTGDIKTGSPYAKITNGSMVFRNSTDTSNVNQTNSTLCSGCVAVVGGVSYYLYKRISDHEWWVTDASGLAPVNVVLTVVTSIKYAFNDVHSAIDGDGTPGVGTLMGGLDLTLIGSRVVLACTEGSLYIGAEIDSAFVTDENYYIKIYSPNNVGVDCNVSRRHKGLFSYNYCLQNGIGDVNDGLEITKDYCVVDGLQITANGSGIKVSGGKNITIINNIIFSTKDDAVVFNTPDCGDRNIIANNIIYDSSGDGIEICHNDLITSDNYFYIYNNTTYKCDNGFYLDIRPSSKYVNKIFLYNNISQKSTTKDFHCTSGPSEFLISKSNYSSDHSISKFYGEKDRDSWNVVFKDAGYKDFHITFYESLRMSDVMDLSADSYYNFLVDIDGELRNRYKWDAGADNWSPSADREIHYSIGNESGNLDDAALRVINIVDNILTFEGTDINSNIGVGDKVVYDKILQDRACYLAERGNDNKWLVRNYVGALLVADESNVEIAYVRRVSNDLTNALDGVGAKSFQNEYQTRNLIGGGVSVLFAWCYYDGAADIGNVTIQGWNTNSDHIMKILSPWNENTQVGASQRHLGLWGSAGFSIEATGAKCIDIDNNYVNLEGIRVKPLSGNPAVTINSGYGYCNVIGNVIKEATIGIRSLGIANDNNAIGNIVYDTTVSGIDILSGSILSNTLVGSAGNGVVVTSNTDLINNIINGFPTCISGTPGKSKLNIISDAVGSVEFGNKINATLNFNDSTSKDFHLRRDDLIALNQGADLINNTYHPFYYDIDMGIPIDHWSVGAHIHPGFDDIDLYFSVSKNQADLRESINTKITISEGVATFSEAQTKDLGIGDRVIYTGGECYLYQKITQIVWYVRNKYGLIPDDVSNVSVTSIKHSFNELGDAVYGSGDSGIKEFLGDVSNPFFNLIAAQYKINFPVYKSATSHTSDITIKEYVTDENYYLQIYTPEDTTNECNDRQRHEGILDGVLIDPTSPQSILINSNHTTIDGISIEPGVASDGIILNECFGSKITGNIIYDSNYAVKNENGSYVFDDFSSGSIGANWNTEFDANWSIRQVAPNNKIVVAGSPSWDRVSKDCQDDIDFEFGIYIDEQDSSEIDSIKIGVYGVSDNLKKFEVSYEVDGSGNHSIGFDGANFILADAIPGRVYKLRITRGREITQDGVHNDTGAANLLRLYYFDDFSDGDGTGTGKWIAHPDIATVIPAYIGNVYIEIYGDSRHGISYIKGWSGAGTFAGDLAEGPGYLVSSHIVNNILYTAAVDGIKCGGLDYVYNNTINDVGGLAINNIATDEVLNNICAGTGIGFNDNTTIDYCIAGDSSVGSDRNNNQYTMVFEDGAAGDFHPHFDDLTARGKARKMIGNPDFPFDFDATAALRGRLWDIGALEYVPEKIVCYAVGKYTGNVGDIGGYSIQEDDFGRSVITFVIPQINVALGIGNRVIDQDTSKLPDGCLLFEKIDNSNWVVKDYYGDNVPDVTYSSVKSIKRPFNRLKDALEYTYANTSGNLVNNKTQVRLACYNDSDTKGYDVHAASIENLVCDPDYFLRIYAPTDISKEVNSSQKHSGKYSTGFTLRTYTGTADDYALYISSVDFIEVEGLSLYLRKASGHYTSKNTLKITNSNNVFLSSNIIRGKGHGINFTSKAGAYPTDKDVIINNIIYDTTGDGLRCGSDSEITDSRLIIYNNTIIGCRRGLYLIHPSSGDSVDSLAKNNIIQDSILQDYVEEEPGYSAVFSMYNNISRDSSSKLYGGSENIINTEMIFTDKASGNFDLDKSDVRAIDDGLDLSNDSYYPFSTDSIDRVRSQGEWDIGAFELIDAIGEGEFSIGTIIVNSIPFSTNTPPSFSLYLREDKAIGLPEVPVERKKTSIIELNTYLSDNASIYDGYNLTIYVEGGKSFAGSFEFNDKGSRTVLVKTLLEEAADYGPGSIVYDGPIIDDSSLMSKITFDGVKIYSDDALTSDYLLNDTYPGTLEMEFINSIIQVNLESVANTVDCTVKLYNSIIVFRTPDSISTPGSGLTFLNKNSVVGNTFINSMALSCFTGILIFTTTNIASNDMVINCLGYNYGDGNFQFGNSSTKVIKPRINNNPNFIEAVVTPGFTPSVLMVNEFRPDISSIVVDNGENSHVEGGLIPYDIVGGDRIFDFKTVDIGPYELEVHNFSFTSDDLLKVFQDKLNIDYVSKKCTSTFGGTIYNDLYYQFLSSPLKRREFLRESKIIFKVKEDTSEHRVYTDKENAEVNIFEAYYDSGTRSIIISKGPHLFDELFNNIFGSGKYIFYFNEVNHRLTVYVNQTYDKGLSGDRNVVKNVRFGGPSIMSN